MFRPSSTVASFSLGCSRQVLLHRLEGQPRGRATRAGAAPLAAQEGSKQTMEPELERMVRCIHGSATKAAVYVTGGASQVRQACRETHAHNVVSEAVSVGLDVGYIVFCSCHARQGSDASLAKPAP
jgi:hypothetical protein